MLCSCAYESRQLPKLYSLSMAPTIVSGDDTDTPQAQTVRKPPAIHEVSSDSSGSESDSDVEDPGTASNTADVPNGATGTQRPMRQTILSAKVTDPANISNIPTVGQSLKRKASTSAQVDNQSKSKKTKRVNKRKDGITCIDGDSHIPFILLLTLNVENVRRQCPNRCSQ